MEEVLAPGAQKRYLYLYSYDFFWPKKSLFLIFLPRLRVERLVWLDSRRFFMQIRVVDVSKAHF